MRKYEQIIKDEDVKKYIKSIKNGTKLVNLEQKQMVDRFLKDLNNKNYEFRTEQIKFVINIIQLTLVNIQGEDKEANSFVGRAVTLLPWQKFIIYNLFGFFIKGTNKRRFKEAFIFVPRKNGKTTFVASLTWATALLSKGSGSKTYIVGHVLKQALESFSFIKRNIELMGEGKNFIIKDNTHGHSVQRSFENGSIEITALAGNSNAHDSLNSNIQICDELHAYKSANVYNVIKESGKAYTNKLCIGISTAGKDINGFCGQRLNYTQKVLANELTDEQMFIFVAKADDKEKFDSDEELIKANPSIDYTVKLEDLRADAYQARHDPQQRSDFLQKSLNIFCNTVDSYFDIEEFKESDKQYNWTIDELAKLPISWFGGADLSKLHDLTATGLYGSYKGVDICITHAFFPRNRAMEVREEYAIPFEDWEESGVITLSDTETVFYDDVINWFINMRKKGFKIKMVGYDRKFSNEFFTKMKAKRFRMFDEPQLHIFKSQGFRRIEQQVKNKKFYYLHSKAYEYCISNVKAMEMTDDLIKYEKVTKFRKIDLFDASVFACMRFINMQNKSEAIEKFLGS